MNVPPPPPPPSPTHKFFGVKQEISNFGESHPVQLLFEKSVSVNNFNSRVIKLGESYLGISKEQCIIDIYECTFKILPRQGEI